MKTWSTTADRPLTLAVALDKAADLIETSCYDWKLRESCNCGMLARAVTNLPAATIAKKLMPAVHQAGYEQITWTSLEDRVCPLTGMPENEILAALYSAGMVRGDLNRLEYLRDAPTCRRAGLARKKGIIGFRKLKVHRDWTARSHASAYMRAWAAMIREYRAAHDETVTPAEIAAVDKVLDRVDHA